LWIAPGPSILPLRRAATIAEDLAWLSCAYPGRVGAAFVPGYQQRDFDAVGVDFELRHRAFWSGIEEMAAHQRSGESPIADDPAIGELRPAGVPMLAGIGGPIGARRAAEAGVGLLLMSLRPPAELAEVVARYHDHVGRGPIVLIRRVSLGATAAGLAANLDAWQSASSGSAGSSWLQAADGAAVSGSPERLVDDLQAAMAKTGAAALNLRLDAYSTGTATQLHDQIAELGERVLPNLHTA
jgi:alkanesulfonate monooxygenase SsuD/methylene tetrahydromethanopterin reductase-like flavin-dependent oxidoreductase (luciferase family)